MLEKSFCNFCSSKLSTSLIDLGYQPYANNYLSNENMDAKLYPLHVKVCDSCKLVQHTTKIDPAEIFDDYGYFSSYSSHWLDHCLAYTNKVCDRFNLNQNNEVLELASNDGYLLKYFKERGVQVIGVDPAKNVAEQATNAGIHTIVAYFGIDVAKEINKHHQIDLTIANNVLAHVPDINDFVSGIAMLLSKGGVCTIEFPHFLNLISELQFDTIYHEHFSYLSLTALKNIFLHHSMKIFDVEKLTTHGGSLRVYVTHKDNHFHKSTAAVGEIIQQEENSLIFENHTLNSFEEKVRGIKDNFLDFIDVKQKEGSRIAGFGAAAKGNTFLNYLGVDSTSIAYVTDDTPYKQKKYLPGSKIPIVSNAILKDDKPDYLVILPWNHKDEIIQKHKYIFDWGGCFVTAIPELEVISSF